MRKFATTGALCAIVLSTSLASAKDDFGALLSQLSYNQPSTASASVPSYKVASNAAVHAEAAQNAGTPQAISMPAPLNQQAVVTQNQHYAAPTAVSYQQGCDVPVAGCGNGSCASGSCGRGICGLGSRRDGSCGEGVFCTPHNQPNLPGSTLRQYWRSNSCHSNVWDGYQNKCRKPLFGNKSCGCGTGGNCGSGNCGGGSCADGSCASGSCAGGSCAGGACDVVMPSQAACDAPQYAVPSYSTHTAAASCDSGSCDSNVWSK